MYFKSYGHIINFFFQPFSLEKNSSKIYLHPTPKDPGEEISIYAKLQFCSEMGLLKKLHNTVVFIKDSQQQIQTFKQISHS